MVNISEVHVYLKAKPKKGNEVPIMVYVYPLEKETPELCKQIRNSLKGVKA